MKDDYMIFRREYANWCFNGPAFVTRISLEILYDYAFNNKRDDRIPDFIADQIDEDRVLIERLRGRMQRKTSEYAEWRMNVFDRDGFTCQLCGQVGGKLNAHHIKPYAKYPELRLDVNNGITLCERCHRALHKKIRESARERHEE